MIVLDRERDARADQREWRNGTTSLGQQCKSKGGNFDHNLERRRVEARKILRAAGHPDSTPIPLYMLGPSPDNMPPDQLEPVDQTAPAKPAGKTA